VPLRPHPTGAVSQSPRRRRRGRAARPHHGSGGHPQADRQERVDARDRGLHGARESRGSPNRQQAAGDGQVQVSGGAKANGIELKQTYAKEGQLLGCKAGRYAHARQFKRMRKVIKRQRTIVGRLQREVGRKMSTLSQAIQETLGQTLGKAKRLVTQTGSRKAVDNRAKLYSWHAP